MTISGMMVLHALLARMGPARECHGQSCEWIGFYLQKL